jgi:hypothetical protein
VRTEQSNTTSALLRRDAAHSGSMDTLDDLMRRLDELLTAKHRWMSKEFQSPEYAGLADDERMAAERLLYAILEFRSMVALHYQQLQQKFVNTPAMLARVRGTHPKARGR